jgi:hypothetical protein
MLGTENAYQRNGGNDDVHSWQDHHRHPHSPDRIFRERRTVELGGMKPGPKPSMVLRH